MTKDRRETTGAPAATAIILAGGRSSRFGRDKLAEPLGGRPLLHHALLAIDGVASDAIVVSAATAASTAGPTDSTTAAPSAPPSPADVSIPIRVIHDPEPFGGPLVALGEAIDWAIEPLALVVAGDMPTMQRPVLAAMLRLLEAGEADAVVLSDRGRRQPLPAAVRVGAASIAVRSALADGERSMQALFDRLVTRELPDSAWRTLDPEGSTLRDIDSPEDLGAAGR